MPFHLTSKTPPVVPSMRESLIATYCPILDSKALCKILCFPSVAALNAAKTRGRLPFKVVEFEGRRGVFARTADIANYLDATFEAPLREFADIVEPEATAPDSAESA